MDVIGNNIANVNTFGFKSSRTTFQDVFYQTMSRGSGPTGLTGGTNPTQIGYGSAVASIDLLMSQSGMASTDRALDIYINGEGMIPVRDANNNILFTRLGVLGFDANGNLVDSNGNMVMGFPMDPSTGRPIVNPDGSVSAGNLAPISVPSDMLDRMVGVSIAPNGEIVGMLPGDTVASLSQAMPPWLHNVTIPADSDLVGNINVSVSLNQSVIPGAGGYQNESTLPADWVRSVRAADGIAELGGASGINPTFTFNQINQTITATLGNDENGNPITFTGQYRRGAEVELRRVGGADAGKLGFVVGTDFTARPPAGSGVDTLGSLQFVSRPMITVSGTDAGGNMLSQSIPFGNPYQLNKGEMHFGELGVTLTIDGTQTVDGQPIPSLPYSRQNMVLRAADFAGHSWLRGVSFNEPMSSSGGSGMSNADVQLRVSRQLPNIPSAVNGFVNGLDRDQLTALINSIYDGPTPAMGTPNFRIQIEETSTGNFQMLITDTETPANTLATSASFTPGGDITFPGGFNIGAAHSGISATSGDGYLVAVDYVREVRINDGSWQAWNGQSSMVLAPVDGGDITRNVTLNVVASDLRAAFSELLEAGSGTVSSAEQIGSMEEESELGWNFSGTVANAQAGLSEAFTIGLMALGTVPNAFAMEQAGSSYFVTTPNSGEAQFFRPGQAGSGTLRSGFLEMSNVDVSKEFTDMIVTQRGFQANTRIITVSDEMLVELVNLRR